jgi:hypothetical protein
MADKFEREIEEILAKLDDELPPGDGRAANAPISIAQKRQQKAKAQRVRTARPNPLASLSPTTLLFTGAGVMFGGLLLSAVWSPAIWFALVGVFLFIGAFALSFRKTSRPAAAPRSQGTFWRDRYINDRPDGGIKDRFRRK